ncbi:MAG: 3'-5' exonuclease [Labilithrix sp.]
MLDEHDELAAANIDALTGWRGGSPDEWLANRLRDVASGGTHGAAGEELADWRGALRPLRDRLAWVSPAEAFDLVLEALDIIWLCARWPDSPQRVANLDALRGVATNYEARCAQEREAATVAGLVRYFDDVRSPTLQRDEMLPSDDQHIPTDDGAVVVCTYHKSKGLEWPVVILANLDRPERRDAFEVSPESDESGFDPENPLAHRRIRYWPWPFGATERAPLRDRAEQSPEGRAVAQREERERARLLYVGFTRPRDHLVLSIRTTKQKAAKAWLDVLGEDAALELPLGSLDRSLAETRMGATRIATRVWRLGAESVQTSLDPAAPRWFARPSGQPDVKLPYRIKPSAIAQAEAEPEAEAESFARGAAVGAVERFERGIPLRGRPTAYDAIGHAIHAFLAADVEGLSTTQRSERAERLLQGWRVSDFIAAEDVLRAGDVLRSWVDRRFGAAVWHREIPVEGPVASLHGERWVSGIVDLLVETSDGFVLIDHKTFPAPSESAWRAKCATFIPQLATYERLITTTQSKPVIECWIHLPLGGGMVSLRLGIDSATSSPSRSTQQSGAWKT